ncbi:Lon protease family protein [Heyndrickxia coagulans]|uniref:endopeptidase La n=1 Tax=Heyndrickxia coagulans TaxID=1398 RepID=A0AAW7CHQ3_HEYCO|nr:ATP-binding protein [Heyndrickxia coagulans]MDL5040066.1 ATP-binding protein [Heyndrickxia coagulans]
MNQEEYETVLSIHRVPVSKLRSECSPEQFPFETTADLETLPNEMIGQQRAEQAMDFGLSVEQSGYNLFVVGPSGTGRMTYTQHSVKKLAKERPVPDDWCYVNNFENPDRPLVINLPAGSGIQFQRRMENLLIDIEREIRATFSNEETEKKKRSIIDESQNQVEALWKETEAFAADLNFKLERTPAGIQSFPLFFGRPMEKQEYEQLSDANKEKLKEWEKQLGEKINETLYQIRKIEEQLRKNLDRFNKQTAAFAIEGLFQPLKEAYHDIPKVLNYLEEYYHDVVEHFSLFLTDQEEENIVAQALAGSKEQQLHRYAVNLLVSHKNRSGAPVIYETNPTYQNLFGKIEYRGAFGSWTTDFTFVKPGAVHLANGGYLILQAAELLQQPYAWTLLKRALQTGQIQIEDPFAERGVFPASGLKPEPIPLKIKVIIIGSYYLYDLLSSVDEDFHKLFKVKVEFDTVMKRNEENRIKMAHFIKNYAERKGLLPFHRRAVAKVIDHSSRLAEEQEKLTARFQDITKILVESSYWAKKEGAPFVDEGHIRKALEEQSNRANHISEQYREMIANGTIMVDTDGERIGQINGLAVMGTRDATFGIPTKITARTFVGKSGIMNIERETSLSGQIHNKGLLILTGFLSGVFAKNHPIPLSASITFEQTYSLIDGDSASSTELYVLLSSLAGVPIQQGIAVTGSVNQWGEIQPIGGVNEKIEGFFAICKERGLTGRQGVIIPQQNIANLMLNDEVVEAVKVGKFHVWAVRHISEGIEILTGESAGAERNAGGRFPEGTIFAKVEERFHKMYESVKEANQ